MITFKELIEGLIIEELHPDLKKIISGKSNGYKSKIGQITKTIKDLSSRGEKTGIETNMPKGSSRAYMKHEEPHHINLDGKPTTIHTGTKVAIRASLDKYHNHAEHDGMSLGALQNHAENGDHWVNRNYRILEHHEGNHYTTNHDMGIFPPLVDHDDKNREWSHVGHVRDIKSNKEFKSLTKSESHPEGISHHDFADALIRQHEKNNGKYWKRDDKSEAIMDHNNSHPLVQKFNDYHGNSGNPPHDFQSMKNMGVFEHPNGSKHIVARDHGYSTEVQQAYAEARRKQASKYR